MELMQNSSSTGHHGMQMDLRGSDEGIGGSWHSSKSSASKDTDRMLQLGSSMQINKGKAKEVLKPVHRSPRRLATSKAMEIVMRNSAPPAAATMSNSPPAESSSEAIADTSNLLTATSSSPSRVSPLSPLTNTLDVSRRRVQSLSPLPNTRSNGILQHTFSAPPTSAEDSIGESCIIDEAEQNEFHFKAALDNDTSILPRPPPILPYDSSYLPLSPNNTDQLGHVLLPVTTPGQSAAKGIGEMMIKQGRGHATLNKKVLPGQDLEEHIVSQIPGQRAMPWGLQTTLIESQIGGKRAKTKMGTLKRTAQRDINRRGKLTPATPTLKLEDDLVSETDSPRLPLIEISEVVTTTTMPGIEVEEVEKKQGLEEDDSNEKQRESESLPPAPEANGSQFNDTNQPVQITDTIPKKRAKGRKSQMLNLASWPTSADESMQSGESSSQEGFAIKQPREARKRLKLIGGYYCKLPRHREDKQDETEVKSDAAAPIDETAGSISRGTSFAPEDVAAPNQDQNRVNGSQSDQNAGMSSSPPPPNSDNIKQATMNAPLTGSLRRMTTAAPLQSSPSKLMHASGEAANTDANDVGNNEYCETCQGVGHFICCDGCPRSFHFACINPPLDIDELPNSIGDASDTWYCNVCRGAGKGRKGREKGKQSGSIFVPLIRSIEVENPTIFSLPLDIRNYFKGIATASDGTYISTSMLRPIKVNKFGIVEEREPLRLKDKNGRPILCFHCGESAMPSELALSSPSRHRERPARQAAKAANAAVFSQIAGVTMNVEEKGGNTKAWRSIVSCDFCSLHWHLDCLDPPLASMPSLSRKWMCPNHIEHVMPSERIPKSVANSTSVHELPMPSAETIGPGKHYRMRVVNDGQIDIIPDPMDTYVGPAHDVNGIANIGGSNLTNGQKSSSSSSSTGSGEKGWQEILLPAYKGYPTVFGNQNNVKFKYRIPEKVIRLDFWSKVELQREKLAEIILEKEHKTRKDGLNLLAIVANAASLEQQDKSDEVLKQSESKPMTKLMAKEIVNTIFSEDLNHPYIEPGQEPVSLLRQSYNDEDEDQMEDVVSFSGPSSSLSTISTQDSHRKKYNDVSDGMDTIRLQSIQQLIAYKGKEALLRFLME